MSNSRKPTKDKLKTHKKSIFGDISDRLISANSAFNLLAEPLKKGIATPSKTISQAELNNLSNHAKDYAEKLKPFYEKSAALAKNFTSINSTQQLACISSLETTLNSIKEAKNSLLDLYNGEPIQPIKISILDEIKLELDTINKNNKNLSKKDREILKEHMETIKLFKQLINEAHETSCILLAKDLCKKSPEFNLFHMRLEGVEKILNMLKSAQPIAASVSANSFLNKKEDKSKTNSKKDHASKAVKTKV